LSIRAPALLLKRFRRREVELFPSRHVQLPCLSARLNRSLMEPSTRLDVPPMFLADRRWRPRTIEKLPHNFAETLNFCLLGKPSVLMLIWFSGQTVMLSASRVKSSAAMLSAVHLVRSDENGPSTDRRFSMQPDLVTLSTVPLPEIPSSAATSHAAVFRSVDQREQSGGQGAPWAAPRRYFKRLLRTCRG